METTGIDDDHDQRFKIFIREFLPDFIDCFFKRWYDRFNFSHVEWLEQEAFLYPPHGEQKIMDLVAQIRVNEPIEPGNNDCLLLIHIEVDSSNSAAKLRRRMLQYYAFLRRSHQLPVLPIALFLYVGLDGISRDTYQETLWGETLIRFDYYSIGLPGLDGMEYANGPNMLGLALSALMRLPKQDRARFLLEGLDRIVSTSENDYRKYLLVECLDNYTILDESEQLEFERLKAETQPMNREFIGGFERRAMAIGKVEGKARGESRGVTLGQRKVLLRQLNKKFGALTLEQTALVEAMSADQLYDVSLEILDARSLSELSAFQNEIDE